MPDHHVKGQPAVSTYFWEKGGITSDTIRVTPCMRSRTSLNLTVFLINNTVCSHVQYNKCHHSRLASPPYRPGPGPQSRLLGWTLTKSHLPSLIHTKHSEQILYHAAWRNALAIATFNIPGTQVASFVYLPSPFVVGPTDWALRRYCAFVYFPLPFAVGPRYSWANWLCAKTVIAPRWWLF